jgi:preprotein translocase subunit SecA
VEAFGALARRVALLHLDRLWADHLAWLTDVRESIHLVSLGGKEPADEFMKAATEAFDAMEERVGAETADTLASYIARPGPVDLEAEGLKGPSSTWTYLVDEDQFGWGVEMLKGRNVGFAAAAAGVFGPLFVLTLLAGRLKKKRPRRERKDAAADEHGNDGAPGGG